MESVGSGRGHTNVAEWSVTEVADWLQCEGFKDEASKFTAEAINGKVLLLLTSDELKNDLGVVLLGLRKMLLMEIEKLRAGLSSQPVGTEAAAQSRFITSTLVGILGKHMRRSFKLGAPWGSVAEANLSNCAVAS